jgi:hypothetical protein
VGDPAHQVVPAKRERLELADIFRDHAERVDGLTPHQERVVQAIIDCRTAALGGHLHVYSCGHEVVVPNSCRDRHCPKCQALDEVRWVENRLADLLPVEHFHVVLTVPAVLHPLFISNPETAYGLLLQAAARTLQEVAFNPKRLGAKIGITVLLHTWTQKMLFHPHVHCIVPGGGLDPDGSRFIPCKRHYLLPREVLWRVFRGKLLEKLQKALDAGTIDAGADDGKALLEKASTKKWVAYCKPPMAGPEQVVKYLGRYTHRIAISNDRLVSMEDGQVTFRWKDRADGNQPKLMTLRGSEFVRRFLLHVLPPGFMRVRHYGLLANSVRRDNLAVCRKLLGVPEQAPSKTPRETWQEMLLRITGRDVNVCPVCHEGRLVRSVVVPPEKQSLPGRGTSP